MPLFAELDENNVVRRVIVADSATWPETHLGGRWVETRDRDTTERYASVGDRYVNTSAEKFEVAPTRTRTRGLRPLALRASGRVTDTVR